MSLELNTIQNKDNTKSGSLKLLTAGIVIVAIVVAGIMIKMGQTTAVAKPVDLRLLVSVKEIKSGSYISGLEATGTVKAANEVVVMPEISGKVAWVSKKLIPGTQVRKGDVLLKMDQREAKLMLKQSKANVKAMEIALHTEEAMGDVAKKEWELSGEAGEASALGSRTLQLESARLNLESAQSAVSQAELRLERTVIRAPFSANVVNENIDVGQVIGPATQICRLVGNEKLQLELSIPVEALSRISLPKNSHKKGSEVKILQKVGAGKYIERQGFVHSVIGEMDIKTRRVQILVLIDERMQRSDLPLLSGAFVQAKISGDRFDNVWEIPRVAIHEGNKVWTVSPEKTLQEKQLEVLWSENKNIYVNAMDENITIVSSPLTSPVNGLKIKIENSMDGKGVKQNLNTNNTTEATAKKAK